MEAEAGLGGRVVVETILFSHFSASFSFFLHSPSDHHESRLRSTDAPSWGGFERLAPAANFSSLHWRRRNFMVLLNGEERRRGWLHLGASRFFSMAVIWYREASGKKERLLS